MINIHKYAYTRLKPSVIHGIGVFAIRDIPKGTNIFADEKGEMVWIDQTEVEKLGGGRSENYMMIFVLLLIANMVALIVSIILPLLGT